MLGVGWRALISSPECRRATEISILLVIWGGTQRRNTLSWPACCPAAAHCWWFNSTPHPKNTLQSTAGCGLQRHVSGSVRAQTLPPPIGLSQTTAGRSHNLSPPCRFWVCRSVLAPVVTQVGLQLLLQ